MKRRRFSTLWEILRSRSTRSCWKGTQSRGISRNRLPYYKRWIRESKSRTLWPSTLTWPVHWNASNLKWPNKSLTPYKIRTSSVIRPTSWACLRTRSSRKPWSFTSLFTQRPVWEWTSSTSTSWSPGCWSTANMKRPTKFTTRCLNSISSSQSTPSVPRFRCLTKPLRKR